MSLDALVSNSYTVEQTKSFADRFAKCESNSEKAVMAVAMLVLGPAALAALILADAFRGAAYIADSLYNWNDKVIVLNSAENELSSDIRLEGTPAEEILAEAKSLKDDASNQNAISLDMAMLLDKRREELANKVAEHISTMNTEQEQIDFIKEVGSLLAYAAVSGKEEKKLLRNDVNFHDYLKSAAFDVMRTKFLAEFSENPVKAITRFVQMGVAIQDIYAVSLEVFSEDNLRQVQEMFISFVLANSDSLDNIEIFKKLDCILSSLEEMGLPKGIDVIEIRNKIIDIKISEIAVANGETQIQLESANAIYEEVKKISTERDQLSDERRGLVSKITELRSKCYIVDFKSEGEIHADDPEAEKKLHELEMANREKVAHAKAGIGFSKEKKAAEALLMEMNEDYSKLSAALNNKLGGETVDGLRDRKLRLEREIESNNSEITKLNMIKESCFAFFDQNDVDDGYFPVGDEESNLKEKAFSPDLIAQSDVGSVSFSRPSTPLEKAETLTPIQEEEEKSEPKKADYPSIWEVFASFTNAFNGAGE